MTSSQHVYEIRARKDHRGVNLISDALPFGRAFALARFAFWIRPASWNARLRLTKQIENCEVRSGNALHRLIFGSMADVEKRVVGQFELEDFAER